jgi:sulfur carrier protein
VPISINGERVMVAAATLDGLLRERGHAPDAALACAVNGLFVPRAQWSQQALRPNDRIDIVAPVTGG